jgi:hypothetical protein
MYSPHNPLYENPFAQALRLAKEEEDRKKYQQGMSALLGLSLLGGLGLALSQNDNKKVFVSFDYENDKHYKFLLEAWHAHPNFKFVFQDTTSNEIQSNSVAVVKQALAEKIKTATHTLVIVGQYANSLHRDYKEIGSRNWINYEIMCSKFYKKKIVAIKLNRDYTSPEELLGAGASWAMSFTEETIIKALEQV